MVAEICHMFVAFALRNCNTSWYVVFTLKNTTCKLKSVEWNACLFVSAVSAANIEITLVTHW